MDFLAPLVLVSGICGIVASKYVRGTALGWIVVDFAPAAGRIFPAFGWGIFRDLRQWRSTWGQLVCN